MRPIVWVVVTIAWLTVTAGLMASSVAALVDGLSLSARAFFDGVLATMGLVIAVLVSLGFGIIVKGYHESTTGP